MLSEAAMKVLELMSGDEEDEYGYTRELVHNSRLWVIGVKRIPKRLVDELIRHCCISVDSFSEGRGIEHWAINGTGRDMLVHPEETSRYISNLLRAGHSGKGAAVSNSGKQQLESLRELVEKWREYENIPYQPNKSRAREAQLAGIALMEGGKAVYKKCAHELAALLAQAPSPATKLWERCPLPMTIRAIGEPHCHIDTERDCVFDYCPMKLQCNTLAQQPAPEGASAMRALESLTCGGSEFVGDVDACVAYVRKKISVLQDIAKKATVRNP